MNVEAWVWWWLAACRPGDGSPTGDTAPVDTGPLDVTVEVAENPANALERRFSLHLSRAVPVELRCTSPDEPDEDHRLPFDGTEGELRLYGLLPELLYRCALVRPDGREAWTGNFRTDPLPADLPGFVVSGDAARATLDEGYVLLSHWRAGADRVVRLLAVDGQGRVRWYSTFPDAANGGIAAAWLGDRMVVGGGGVTPSLRNLSSEVLFEVAPPAFPNPGEDVYHHEAQLTPEGLLSLQTVPDTDGAVTWRGFRIEVTDLASGAVVWDFDSIGLREAGLLPPGTPDDDDPYHANAVTWRDDDPDGPSVWVSLRGVKALMRIDRRTDAVTFVGPERGWTLVDPRGDPLPARDWFWGQHAPRYDGDGFLVYDNGSTRPGAERYSRVARYRRTGTRELTLEWDWREPGWYEPNWGAVAELAGGHVFVATGHCAFCDGTGGEAATGWLAEVDPDTDDVVWRLDFEGFEDTTYRGQVLDGCALFANARYCPTLR